MKHFHIMPRVYCLCIAVLSTAIGLGGCAESSTSVIRPQFLQTEIKEQPPADNTITAYATNGPFGGGVTCLASSAKSNTLFAGTDSGEVFRYSDNNYGGKWTQGKIELGQGVTSDIIAVGSLLFAGTSKGMFRSADDGLSWQSVGGDIVKESISKLLLFGDRVIGVTSQGIWLSDRQGTSWSQLPTSQAFGNSDSEGPRLFEANSLATAGGYLLVADRNGIQRSQDLKRWEKSNQGLGLADFENSSVRSLVEVRGTLFAITSGDKSNKYRSTDGGTSWREMLQPGPERAVAAFAAGDSLFIDTGENIRRELNGAWVDLGYPDEKAIIKDVLVLSDAVTVATDRGVYTRNDHTGLWKENDRGIRTHGNPGAMVTTTTQHFVILDDDKLYRSDNRGESWSLMSNPSSRDGWDPFSTLNDLVTLGGWLFVATSEGLYKGSIEGESLFRVGSLPTVDDEGVQGRKVQQLATDGNTLIAVEENRVFRSQDHGEKWELVSEGLEKEQGYAFSEPMLEFAGNTLILSYGDRRNRVGANCYRLRKGTNNWEEIKDGLGQRPITAATFAGDTVYAGASSKDSNGRGGKFSPELFTLEHVESDGTWKRLTAGGVTGEVKALWIDPAHQDVIIAGTSDGLFWSNDGGQQFSQVRHREGASAFGQIGAIAYKQGQLLVNADTGVFYLYDQIPRGKWYARWWGRISQHQWLLSGTALAVLLMIVLSSRLISLLLKLDILGINQIAPLFYLFAPSGRWKLYRGYRKRLRNGVGLNEDLKYGVEHYIELPFEVGVEVSDGVRLSDLFTQLPLHKRVVVEAEGGRGKSTLCYYLARRCVERCDLFGGKHLEPVVVDGLTYTGDMLQAITGALSKDRAYVNKTIVGSQVAAGNLLVIFEGFSEIKEAYLDAASSSDLPEFVRQHQDTPFIFTSRSSLPPALMQALTDPLTIRLSDVDETTERLFLSQYLKGGAHEVDALMKQIKERFNDLPRIPLMLKLVAAVYDEEGRVPKDAAALFHHYTEHVLREKATGIKFTTGLHYAINHLVRETYLRRGGDRGLTENRGVELLRQIKDELEARNITLSPISLLYVLIRAGLYKKVGRQLKFFHDSFESYFGARALESDFSDGKYELLKQCAGNERLSETWIFLNEILGTPGDKEKLEELLLERGDELSKAAYLKSQRDAGVDCYLTLAATANGYSGELVTTEGKQPVHITIGSQELAKLTKELRRKMECLAFAVQPDIDHRPANFNECLPELATLGHYAFKKIFNQPEVVKKIRKLMPPNRGGSIQIATEAFFFPWELLYPVDPAETLAYENFWGLNHVISRLIVQDPYGDCADVPALPANPRPKLGLFADASINHVREEESFLWNLSRAAEADLVVFGGHDSSNKREMLREVAAFLTRGFDVIHIACRTFYDEELTGNSWIQLADDFRLRLMDIESNEMTISGQPLIIMNSSNGGNLDPLRVCGFATTFLKYGARGVVATECNIPSSTAPAIAAELYTRLLAGDPLGQSLLAIRQALWNTSQNPIGLLYSMYAPPSLKLARPDSQSQRPAPAVR